MTEGLGLQVAQSLAGLSGLNPASALMGDAALAETCIFICVKVFEQIPLPFICCICTHKYFCNTRSIVRKLNAYLYVLESTERGTTIQSKIMYPL